MDVQHFTTNKLINDLKSRSYLAVLVMVIGLALGLTKDYPSIIAENRWSQFFGGFELTAVGLILLVAIRKQMKAVNGLRVEIHDTFIRVHQSGAEHDYHRGSARVSVKATSLELVDVDRTVKLELAHFGDFKERKALKSAVEVWGKG